MMIDMWWALGTLVLGVLLGGLVVWLLNRNAAGPGHSVKALREENERFREQVNDHFVETAELINQLTESYKKVFDHLSDGAERLVDEEVIRERMPQVSDQEIRLKRIGKTTPETGSKSSDADQVTTAEEDKAAAEGEPPPEGDQSSDAAPDSDDQAESASGSRPRAD
jgi:uncharacterized membrane-anchored protein YhcB (DUF1043 family)